MVEITSTYEDMRRLFNKIIDSRVNCFHMLFCSVLIFLSINNIKMNLNIRSLIWSILRKMLKDLCKCPGNAALIYRSRRMTFLNTLDNVGGVVFREMINSVIFSPPLLRSTLLTYWRQSGADLELL